MDYFNYSYFYTHSITLFGGGYSTVLNTGAFCLAMDESAASSDANVGARLIYL